MSTYGVPVLPQSDSDRSVYYSWHESPEQRVLLHQPCIVSPLIQSTEGPKPNVSQKSSSGSRLDSTSNPSVDAKNALNHIAKGTAKGDICALTFRLWLQTRLFKLGCIIESHRWTVLVVGCIVLGLCCLGLKTVRLETDVEKLWVQDSGRIANEMKHTQDMLGDVSSTSSMEALLQTGQNLLHPSSLLDHQRLLTAARQTKVRFGRRTWTFEKLCQRVTIQTAVTRTLSDFFHKMTPCLIITPLDCFWDGAKVLGPSRPAKLAALNEEFDWRTFNPNAVLNQLKKDILRRQYRFVIDSDLDDFRDMGILNGYQNRSCLDPQDPHCPEHQRSYKSKLVDVGSTLRGGCPGFAANFMHWPELLIVGGAEHTRDGSRLTQVKALQSILFLKSPRALYNDERNEGTGYFEWSVEQARHIIRSWQIELRKRVAEMDIKAEAASKAPGSSKFSTEHFYAYTDSSLKDLLNQLTDHVNAVTIGGGAFLVMIYVTVCFIRWKEPITSHTWLAVLGFIICALTIVAGLGFSAVLGLTFNVLTVKVLPFLLLGIAMDDCLRLSYRFDQILKSVDINDNSNMVIGETLKTAGPPLLLASFSNIVAIFAGAFIPVPVMQMFCLQAGLVSCLQLITALLLIPSLLSLDLQRRRGYRVDCLCCLANRPDNPITLGDNPPTSPSLAARKVRQNSRIFTPAGLIRRGLVPAIRQVPVKSVVVALAVLAVVASSYGAMQLSYGINFNSVMPSNSPEYNFVKNHHKLFGVFNFQLSTGHRFDYAKDQRTLRNYFEAIRRVPEVMASSTVASANASSPKQYHRRCLDFWLDCMRDWLLDLQSAFDRDVNLSNIDVNAGGRWTTNVTRKAILGMLLLIQTGHEKKSVDITRIKRARLVNANGIIDKDAFYIYLTAWRSYRKTQYETLRNLIRPDPAITSFDYRNLPQRAKTNEYKFFLSSSIQRSPRIEFTQMNFYLKNVQDSTTMLRAVKAIREITDKFHAMGLDNYPSGIPFIFYEQYFHLPNALALSIGLCFGAIVVNLFFFFFNLPILLLAVGMMVITLAEMCGLCSLLSFHLNGASAAIVIACIGIFSRYQSSILWTFLTGRGSRQRRMERSLVQHGPSIFHAGVAMLLAIAVLAASPLDFIVRYFFQIISVAVILSLLNTLILLPSILSLIGPASQFRPTSGWVSSAISLHDGHPPCDRPNLDADSGIERNALRRDSISMRPRPVSLSTISEEPSRLSSSSSLDKEPPPHPQIPSTPPHVRHQKPTSHYQQPMLPPHYQHAKPLSHPPHHLQNHPLQTRPSVVYVQPEIVVRTNTSQEQRCGRSSSSGPCQPKQICCHDNSGNQVTTVKATAKFKVEVHSPSPVTNALNSVYTESPCSDSGSTSSSSSSSGDTCGYVQGRPQPDTNFLPNHKSTRRPQVASRSQQQHYSPSVHHYSTTHRPKHHHRQPPPPHYHHQRRQVYSHLQGRNRTRDIDDESGIDTCEE